MMTWRYQMRRLSFGLPTFSMAPFLLLFVVAIEMSISSSIHHVTSFVITHPEPSQSLFPRRSPHLHLFTKNLPVISSSISSSSSALTDSSLSDSVQLPSSTSLPSSSRITIERVCTKKRGLDVMIYRGFRISPKEYMEQRKLEAMKVKEGCDLLDTDSDITEEEAIDILMKGYDDNGDYIHHVSPHDHPVFFAALYNAYESTNKNINGEDADADADADDKMRGLDDKFARQNGVMGVVSAQVRNRSNIHEHGGNADVAPACSETYDTCKNITLNDLDPSNLPCHVYLANMSVDDAMRRKGVGTQLLSSVTEYSRALKGVDYVILSVDRDNVGAIQMYQRHGYRFFDSNEEYGGRMFLDVSN